MPDFIHQQFITDLSLCDRIIEAHKNNDVKWPGSISRGVDTAVKDSVDSELLGTLLQEYYSELQLVVDKYIELFPSCNAYAPWSVVERINVQHYAPNCGFKAWHTERSTVTRPVTFRHLVFMTYLNDVTDKGGTEFKEQGITISAQKGKTVIWPVDWTHTHRGVVSPTQDKYIVTGWFSYTE